MAREAILAAPGAIEVCGRIQVTWIQIVPAQTGPLPPGGTEGALVDTEVFLGADPTSIKDCDVTK